MDVINTIGRRKKSIARIYMSKGKGKILVNGREYKEYFPVPEYQLRLTQPFQLTDNEGKYDVKVNVGGGGVSSQAGAVCLAISRALCKVDEEFKPALKAEGLMTRDPRMVERKKSGQKKARKKFQFSKR
ncbi:MAG: 30S ribosomal protein S9 [Bacteroidota bacterium]